MWLARDESDKVYCYSYEPIRDTRAKCFCASTDGDAAYCELDEEDFPEITWENSPIEIKTTKNVSSLLDIWNELSLTLINEVEQENQKLNSRSNTSDILDKTTNYRLGLVNGYLHAQHLITQIFSKNLSEYLNQNKND